MIVFCNELERLAGYEVGANGRVATRWVKAGGVSSRLCYRLIKLFYQDLFCSVVHVYYFFSRMNGVRIFLVGSFNCACQDEYTITCQAISHTKPRLVMGGLGFAGFHSFHAASGKASCLGLDQARSMVAR